MKVNEKIWFCSLLENILLIFDCVVILCIVSIVFIYEVGGFGVRWVVIDVLFFYGYLVT